MSEPHRTILSADRVHRDALALDDVRSLEEQIAASRGDALILECN